jgi:hypothetical protein
MPPGVALKITPRGKKTQQGCSFTAPPLAHPRLSVWWNVGVVPDHNFNI